MVHHCRAKNASFVDHEPLTTMTLATLSPKAPDPSNLILCLPRYQDTQVQTARKLRILKPPAPGLRLKSKTPRLQDLSTPGATTEPRTTKSEIRIPKFYIPPNNYVLAKNSNSYTASDESSQNRHTLSPLHSKVFSGIKKCCNSG